GAKVDVPFFFPNDVWILDYTGEGQIRGANKLLELEPTDAVHEESKHSKIFPGFDLATKGFNVSFLIGPVEGVGDIDANITGQAGHFSEMVHLFGRRT